MKFSIITPVFNESGRIEKCIQSVLNQSFKDFEMIVADDCSQDNTVEKVEFLRERDDRVKLIQMGMNVGVSAARNAALDKVKGEYLVFIDADDWILPNMLLDLDEQLNNVDNLDMFRLRGRKVYTRSEEPAPDPNYETRLCAPVDLIRENNIGGFMHSLVVQNELVQKYNIRFRPGQVMLEDQEFTLKCMVYSSNVLYYTKQNYMYYQHPGSSSNNFKTEHLSDILNCAINVYKLAQNHLPGKDLLYYREYTLMKFDQFLKAVFKDKDYPPEKVELHMDKFLTTVDLPIHQYLLQSVKYRAVKTAKYIRV